jgi:hypothetical protein
MSDALQVLQARVVASPGAWAMLEADAYAPLDADAHRAARLRLERLWESEVALSHALRGEHLNEVQAHALASKERTNALMESDEQTPVEDTEKEDE